MANICTNKVAVTGPTESVRRFVEAAKGPVSEHEYGGFRTELRVIEQVRNGVTVEEAFRNANLKIDGLSHRLSFLPLEYELSDRALLPPVSEEDFEEWAKQIEERVRSYPVSSGDPQATWLSFARLVPMPQEYLGESYHLAGHSWLVSERGPKWVGAVGEPEVLDVDSVTGAFGNLAGDRDEAIVVYPLFDSANSPVFPGLLNASRDFPDLTFLSAFMEPNEYDFRYFAARNGETVAERVIHDGDELPASCKVRIDEDDIGEDGEDSYFDERATLAHLIEMAAMEADAVPAPSSRA